MKKIWKNLCACSMALACGVGIAGCGKDKDPVSVDLDGDGVISSWETLYGTATNTTSTDGVTGEIVYIKDANELMDINNHTDSRKIYVLSRNIDLGGKEVCINLGMSELYGYNKVISNFKLGIKPAATTADGKNVDSNQEIRCMFYGGTGIYGVRLFMGVQNITAGDASKADYYVSPFYNVPALDTIAVKGRLNIGGKKVDGREYTKVHASMLYNGQDEEVFVNGEYSATKEAVVSIRNVDVDGKVVVSDEADSATTLTFGGIASAIYGSSEIYNAYANIDVSGECHNDVVAGGIVGENFGFVSTSVTTGNITLNAGQSLYSKQFVGGIAGVNENLAEIKNCSTNIGLSFSGDENSTAGTNGFYYGGIVGDNKGGIVEYAQSDAKLSVSNLKKITIGGICGSNERGIITYALCRGSIECNKIANVNIAQVSGNSYKGLFEKIVATTAIKVNNQDIDSKVNVGMVTVFENDYETEKDLPNSPYFKRILVDGVTEINIRKADSSKLHYALGLRNEFKVADGSHKEEDSEGNEIEIQDYSSKLPEIYNNLYYTESGCKLYVYEYDGGAKIEKSPTIIYAKNLKGESYVSATSITPRNMIDKLDFKNYLNHNEVSLADHVVLSELHFTLDKNLQEVSYFGESKYNGELAYFDKEFTQSYVHNAPNCDNDEKDEMMSFLYDLVNNGNSGESYAIKVTDDYLGVDWENSGYGEDTIIEGLSPLSDNFMRSINGALECLNTIYSVQKLDYEKVNMTESSGSTKYLEYTFYDSKNTYKILFDISNMESDNKADKLQNQESFIVYLTFSLVSNVAS